MKKQDYAKDNQNCSGGSYSKFLNANYSSPMLAFETLKKMAHLDDSD